MQWLPLIIMNDQQADSRVVLLRTLFLPNGISELPHPTVPDMWGSTAEELLSTPQALTSGKGDEIGRGSPPSSSSSSASTSSTSSCSSSSPFSHSSSCVDRLGFAVLIPRCSYGMASGVPAESPLELRGPTRTINSWSMLWNGYRRHDGEVSGAKFMLGKRTKCLPSATLKVRTLQLAKTATTFFGPEPCSFGTSERREVRSWSGGGYPCLVEPSCIHR